MMIATQTLASLEKRIVDGIELIGLGWKSFLGNWYRYEFGRNKKKAYHEVICLLFVRGLGF